MSVLQQAPDVLFGSVALVIAIVSLTVIVTTMISGTTPREAESPLYTLLQSLPIARARPRNEASGKQVN